jgi:hypothetical protein
LKKRDIRYALIAGVLKLTSNIFEINMKKRGRERERERERKREREEREKKKRRSLSNPNPYLAAASLICALERDFPASACEKKAKRECS